MDALTFKEYQILIKAKRLQSIDEDYLLHRLAYLNFSVQAEKQVGKSVRPVYSRFEKFYDYEKALKEEMETEEDRIKHEEKVRTLAKILKGGD